MSEAKAMHVDSSLAETFLSMHLGLEATEVVAVGEGAWSRCFGFRRGGEELVIRFGHHVEDFRKDQLAYAYASPGLPIPQVLDVGLAFDGYYAISTRVHGVPLETLCSTSWPAVVPSVVSALEAMRRADVSSTIGFGGWGDDGHAPYASWSSFLLAVADDPAGHRTYGWRKRLAASPQGEAAFRWGFDVLENVAIDSVPRCLVHCDLVNRNVLVSRDRISGVFDWGCSLYGDHLYDLAWFEFWSPWYPSLDIRYLRSETERRWYEAGYAPEDKEARLAACYLHIGLSHLAYNAHLGDWAALSATAERMRIMEVN
jgi:hygromycin-B 4-O-kinase